MPKTSKDMDINIKLEIESVTLVEIGITMLSGSKLRLYDVTEMK